MSSITLFFRMILSIATIPNIFAATADLTLNKVLDNCTTLAEMKPSLDMLHLDKKQIYQKIDGNTYEIRYVVYVNNNQEDKNKTLKSIVKENGLGSEKLNSSSLFSNSLQIYSFIQPDSLKNKGVHFIISLRPLKPEELNQKVSK